MPRYYNRSSGRVAVTLTDGSVCSLPPRAWSEIATGQDGCADISGSVKKGILVRAPAELVEPVAPVKKSVKRAVKKAFEPKKTAPEPEPAPEAVSTEKRDAPAKKKRGRPRKVTFASDGDR